MKTKPFLLATAGSTVDGRTIDDKLLTEMASSYDPKTYGARLNIEHVRGVTGDKPFRAYGDVDSLSTAEVDVNFNGKIEKRLGLFGVFDVTDDAKALNDAGQKVYPSIEIEDNFGGKGFAYLMGCALTDSPAAIATQRLQFNRSLPGSINLTRDVAAALEFAEDAGGDAGANFLTKFNAMLDGFAVKLGVTKPEEKPASKDDDAPAPFDFSVLKSMFDEFGKSLTTELGTMRTEFRTEVDGLALELKTFSDEREKTPAHTYKHRPKSDGKADEYSMIF